MKKILSLLSMLMITVTAFATSYTDKLTYKLTVFTALTKDLPAGELTIEPYGTSNYTVTAKGCDLSDFDAGNWDEIVCDDVAGTKDANGVTTITLDNPYAYRTSDNTSFSNTKLVVKFNGTKAYAHFEGKIKIGLALRAFEYTFGTDEGFDGGGSTGGGEDKPAAFEKVNFVGDGTNFDWKIPVNWDTQKIVMSIDPSTCTGNCEDIIGLGEVATAWNNTLHLYRKTDKTLQGYFQIPGGSNNNTNPFDETNPIKVEVSKAQGFVVNGVVKIPASQMSALFALSTVNMGTGEGANDKSRATYKYVKVVDKDWTEVPPVTVRDTKKFENVAYTTSMGGSGTATVTFTEMSDDTFPMTFVSDDLNVKAENLTKGTDEKGRTTYTGTAKRTDVDVTFTVKAVVYGETTAQKLYMTMDNGSSFVVTVGEDPDYVAPVTYKNTLKVVRGTDTKAYENAEVSVLAKGENKYAVTIPSFTDMDATEGTIGKLTFEATGVEENGTLKLTATSATTTQEGGTGWDAAAFTASMDATVTGETLAGTFTVVYPNDATNYTYTLYYGVEPPTTPETPKDVTVVEKYQADGTGFSKTINVDWDKQKIVASIDFSNGGYDKDILAMTTGDSFTAFQTSTYRTMHWYCNQTAKQMSGFFAKDGAGNNNTGRMDVADCLAKFEISKAEGLKVNGEVKMTPTVLEDLLTGDPIIIGSGESPKFSNAYYNYIKVVSLDWKEPTEPEVTVKEEKTFNEALYMVQGTTSTKVADAKVVVKEMSDNTVNMSLQFNGNEYTSTELVKGTDEKNRTTYTGKVSKDTQTFDVAGVVYEKETADRLYMTMTAAGVTFVVGENPDAVTPDVTEVSNKTYTSNLRILDGEEPVVENAEAQVNIIKYSDDSYKVTLKNVNMLNKTQDLVFVGKVITDVTDSEAPLTIMAKSDEATTNVFGEQVSGTFKITEVSADEIKMGFSMESQNFSYQGDFNYTEEEEPEVYTNNLHIYDAAAPETDLFQADQAKVEFLATETGEFKLTLKDVTLNEKTQDLVFTGALPTPQPGGQDPLAEEGETTPAEPAMVLNATADEATATFLGTTSATAVFNVIMNDEAETENDAFALTFTITAGEKTLGGEFNYEKKDPDTPDPELFCKENYVADGTGFEWDINVDWDTQKIVMSIDPSTCTGSCEDVIGLGAVPTAWDNTLHLYRTSADQMLQGYFNVPGGSNNNTDKFAETAPFLVEVSKAQGFVVNNEVKIAASEMSYLFTLPTVKMGTGEGANDKSRATYNYVKVVDKDWTAPKDPDTGINATTVAEGEVEFFTVNGVKLNKLQKGLNIVRTADGKVKKVLVK
ncbi:calycin-like domain-containing protein [Leyella stercorea]|uniref:calycin-like domain-containing protein n=1 Tax=Leyella stercorea TaxID=363265 RepID=UPI0026DCFA21|nr:calycin-like domain-containing protein [Leyella stercorea]